MNEKQLQDFTIKKANERGILAYKMESKSCRGFPDLMLVGHLGRIFFIELKNPSGNGVLSNHQMKVLHDLTTRGCDTYVIDSTEEIEELLRSISGSDQYH